MSENKSAPVVPEGEPSYAELQAMNEEQAKTIRNLRGVMSQWASTGASVPVLTPAKALTDEQIDKMLEAERMRWSSRNGPPTYEFALAFARAIERAHGIEATGQEGK